MSDIVGDGASTASEGPMVDVTDLPLAALVASESTALANAVRRLLDDLREPHDVIAGWQSHQP
jgi:FXSXX-COOH protein